MQKRLTDQEKIDVVAQYKNGMSSCELSKIYGIADTSILALLKRRGVERRSKKDYNLNK